MPIRTRAQNRARRIGVLNSGVGFGPPSPDAKARWQRLGWIEGENLIILRRYPAWHVDRMPEMVDDLLHNHRVELLSAWTIEAAAAAARATRTVPIVFAGAYLPLDCGLIQSYARPGRNCTGWAIYGDRNHFAKRVDFLRAAVPDAQRLAILAPDTATWTLSGAPLNYWPEVLAGANQRGFGQATVHIAKGVADVDAVLQEAASLRAQAATITGPPFEGAVARVAQFAQGQRWISFTYSQSLLEAGLVMSHNLPVKEWDGLAYRSSQMIDRILRGANPADIPVELAKRFELVVNLKAARAIGLTMPRTLLLQADRVIE